MTNGLHAPARGLFRLTHALAFSGCAVFSASAYAARISEIDLGGPAGQGIELSNAASPTGHTLLILDASPYVPTRFGNVLDVIHLPTNPRPDGVVMITDNPWPSDPALTTVLSTLAPASGSTELAFNLSRLLIVMDGISATTRFDNPVTDPLSAGRYDASAVTDWLVLGSGDHAGPYQAGAYDIAGINAALGIDLLSRIVDKDDGRVIGRASHPGQALDMDTFYVGDPDASGLFAADAGHNYVYTPGLENVPLLANLPEPNSLVLLGLGALCVCRRRR